MATQGRRRALGQHFLKDQGTARLIVETTLNEAEKAGCHALLEIGPGRGALTKPLLQLLHASQPPLKSLVICEKDHALATEWTTRLTSFKAQGSLRCRVEDSDFLELPESRWLADLPLAVMSNLPYSSGTAMLSRLARHPSQIPVMVLMFQAEVAQRLRATPNTKQWGSLSVWIQNQWDVTKLKAVPPGAFSPPPEVQSEVLVLRSRPTPRIPVSQRPEHQAKWESLLKACFNHRRKMLRSGLAGTPWKATLEKSGVDGTKRAEALDWEEWQRLFEAT